MPLSNLARVFATPPLSKDAPLQAWLRFASWQLKCRLSNEVIVPWIEGQQLSVRRGMTGATGNIYVGLHEFADMMLPLHFLREGDLFLDIGANVGTYSVLASGVCKAKTWAFEPDATTLRNLRRNIEINGLESLVQVFPMALGETEQEIWFSTGYDTMNKVSDEFDASSIQVTQKPLDDLIGSEQPVMIKMDVEGHEESVLRGAPRLLASPGLQLIELETVTSMSKNILVKNGFGLATYNPVNRRLDADGKASSSNAVYVKDWDFVRSRLETARPIRVLDKII